METCIICENALDEHSENGNCFDCLMASCTPGNPLNKVKTTIILGENGKRILNYLIARKKLIEEKLNKKAEALMKKKLDMY
jgi:hypothetical protein